MNSEKMKIAIAHVWVLSLIGLISIASYGIIDSNRHKSARIRQLNGVGEKIIKDYDNEWEVLPFKVGDTISEYVFSSTVLEHLDPVHISSNYGWVVLEIKN